MVYAAMAASSSKLQTNRALDQQEGLLQMQQETANSVSLLSEQLDAAAMHIAAGDTMASHSSTATMLVALARPRMIEIEGLRQTWDTSWNSINKFASGVCSTFFLSSCCNNPECMNLAKLSEQQLVGGKTLCVCWMRCS